MSKRFPLNRSRRASATLPTRAHASTLAPALLLPFVMIAGCTESGDGGGLCGADLSAEVSALVTATSDLSTRATMLQADVAAACEGIVTDLGGTLPAQGGDTNAYTQAVCQEAANQIAAQVQAGAEISVAIVPPQCTIDAQAQFDCEASCDVNGACTEGSIETRCEPGELSVVCDGTCEVHGYCEATASAEVVNCEGSCQGVCMGECSGSTDATGQCNGTCSGQCQGTCEITGEAAIDCGASARCRGTCTGTATLPECRTELVLPECDIDAECQAGCEGQAQFNATCTEGSVTVVASGDANANLAATLEANLPALVAVAEGFGGLLDGASNLAAQAEVVADDLRAVPACTVVKLNQILAAVSAAADAAASVQVTVSVSVCVSGSTGSATAPSCS
jgi:hypothetical protein